MQKSECLLFKEDSEQIKNYDNEESIPQEDLVTVTINFRLIVRDTGIGIKKDNLRKLFQHFGKLTEGQSQNKFGVGLGLTICSDLVKAFGGTIEVESEEEA